MKRSNSDADISKHNEKQPVRENQPNSIADDMTDEQKEGFPFPDKEGKQYDNQPEFTEPKSNKSEDKD